MCCNGFSGFSSNNCCHTGFNAREFAKGDCEVRFGIRELERGIRDVKVGLFDMEQSVGFNSGFGFGFQNNRFDFDRCCNNVGFSNNRFDGCCNGFGLSNNRFDKCCF